jgi:hypothetical protein
MATEKEEDLLCLIEVVAKEVSLIGVKCHEMRWQIRRKLRELFPEPESDPGEPEVETDAIRLYDETLKRTVERIGDVIGLMGERVNELTAANLRED